MSTVSERKRHTETASESTSGQEPSATPSRRRRAQARGAGRGAAGGGEAGRAAGEGEASRAAGGGASRKPKAPKGKKSRGASGSWGRGGAKGGGGAGGGAGGGGRPPRAPEGGREARIALRAFVVLAFLAAAAYSALVFGYGSMPGPGSGREVELEWPDDLSPETASARLSAAGLVASPTLFAWYLRATRKGADLRPGHHLLTDDMSPSAIASRMQRAMSRGHAKVVLREGLTRFDIAKRLQAARVCGAKAFTVAAIDRSVLSDLGIPADSPEGYLFPSTYQFALDSEPRDVLARLKGEFDKRFDRILRDHPEGVQDLRDTLRWGPHQILTLASMIEKEAMADEERPIIASVFLNRLRDATFTPHRLQSDPTSGYGCLMRPELLSCRNYTGRILPEMNVDEANAYSTYRHEGLPPGPICSPSEKSLAAVVAPAVTRYLFFMAKGEGHHTFSETYAQHNDAIRKVRAAEAAAAANTPRPQASSP